MIRIKKKEEGKKKRKLTRNPGKDVGNQGF